MVDHMLHQLCRPIPQLHLAGLELAVFDDFEVSGHLGEAGDLMGLIAGEAFFGKPGGIQRTAHGGIEAHHNVIVVVLQCNDALCHADLVSSQASRIIDGLQGIGEIFGNLQIFDSRLFARSAQQLGILDKFFDHSIHILLEQSFHRRMPGWVANTLFPLYATGAFETH